MRLAALKIQGFKSFADAVAFKADGALTGVVGPNGCGKSNIVDAIRWTLGESRASSLRGATLPDVLFNGSERRAAADRCGVELRFDNSSGKAGGMWQKHAEIVVKRELARDGGQGYSINGAPVRRRDVVDLFRGTGVAPRAYGIIQQDMISRIADSTPEELRAFMEEAAGVSHYKERRRESERRLQISRENLEQVAVMLDSARKRMEALKRQARKARHYRQLGEEINTLDALLISAKRDAASAQLEKQRQVIGALQSENKTAQNTVAALKAAADKNREKRESAQAALDAAQQRLTEARAAHAAVDRDLQNAAAVKRAAKQRLADSESELAAAGEKIKTLAQDEKTLAQNQSEAKKQARAADADVAKQSAELAARQERQREKQDALQKAREAQNAVRQKREAHALRRQMLGEQTAALSARIADAENQLKAAAAVEEEAAMDLGDDEKQVAAGEAALKQLRDEQETLAAAAAAAEKRELDIQGKIAVLTTEMSTLKQMLGEDGKTPRLARALKIKNQKWARALDAALGAYAAAAAVDDLDAFLQGGKPKAGAAVIELRPPAAADDAAGESREASVPLPTLLSALELPEKSGAMLGGWLAGFYVAADDAAAVAERKNLRFGEYIVTAGGVVYGARSLLAPGEARGGYNWERRMQELSAALAAGESDAEKARADTRARQAAAAEKAAATTRAADTLEQARRQLDERRIEWNRRQERRQSMLARRRELNEALAAMRAEHAEGEAGAASLDEQIAAVNGEWQTARQTTETAQKDLTQADETLAACRRRIDEAQTKKRDADLRQSEMRQQAHNAESRRRELHERRRQLEARVKTCRDEFNAADEGALRETMSERRRAMEAAEAGLDERRRKLRAAEDESADIEKRRDALRGDMDRAQQKIADERIRERELALAVAHCNDALEEMPLSAGQLKTLRGEREGEGESDWQSALQEKRAKRDALGAINFTADSELRECEEARDKLQTQKSDIESAIGELNNAVARIDRETKTRLLDIFNGINREFTGMFKRLFAGGEARLEMDGNAILDAGFELRVRPPGKKQFAVRMLSGGEKAAAAVAFVFSILRLNPPPFCVLDEVDAPLDDNRAERFSALLRDIAANVQCLVITHNKSTIAAMPRLVGVTQEEPGVSKVVSVNLDDALRAAGA